MCRQKAIAIVRNLNYTLENMPIIDPTSDSQLFTPTRASKKKLKNIKDRIIRKYNLSKDN